LNEIYNKAEESDENLFLIGKILKPFGIKGELLVKFFPDPKLAEYIFSVKKIYLTNNDSYNLKKIRKHQNYYVITLETIVNRDQGELLSNKEIYVDKSQVRQSNENSYYWFEVLGCSAYDVNNSFLGIIEQIVNNGVYDIFVVYKNEKEIMIPGINPFVVFFDKQKKIITFNIIPGLTDINDAF